MKLDDIFEIDGFPDVLKVKNTNSLNKTLKKKKKNKYGMNNLIIPALAIGSGNISNDGGGDGGGGE